MSGIRLMKYYVEYGTQTFMGNSVDEVATNMRKRHNDLSWAEAVRYVERNKKEHQNGVRSFKIKTEMMNERTKASGKGKKTWEEIKNGAIAVLKNISGKTVPQIEIDRRTAICNKCPKRSEISVCAPCGGAGKLTNAINSFKQKYFKSGYNLEHEMKPTFCSICDCSLALMLPCKLEDFSDQERKNPERPFSCWVSSPPVDPSTIN